MINRIHYLDFTRTYCMLWIIVILHNHIPIITGNIISEKITIAVLGSFTLISGMLISKSIINIKNINDIFIFYYKRLKRLYIPFAISCLTLFFIKDLYYISSLKQLIASLLLFSNFIGLTPGTVWYVVLIFSFYFLSPILCINNNKYIFVLSVLFLCIFYILIIYVKCDVRYLYFFPTFVFGLINPKKLFINKKTLLLCIILFIITMFVKNRYINIFVSLFGSLFFLNLFYYMEKYIKNIKIKNIISYISIASMFMYLFHRQYNYLCDLITGEGLPFLRILLFPLFIIVCYHLQIYYNILINKGKR